MTNPEFGSNPENEYLRDLRPEMKPVEEIEAANAKLVETARVQLEQLKPSLNDLMQRIIDEKPELVVFLDKGARVLGTPIAKFLRDKTESLPEIRFYNDDRLKGSYLNFKSGYAHEDDFWKVVEKDFAPYKGKKIFFIDETFSGGKGAAALSSAIVDAGVDGYYFALTKDPDAQEEYDWDEDKNHRVSYQQMMDAVDRLRQNGKLKIYGNNIGYLFTKDASALYVIDKAKGQTGSRYEVIPKGKLEETYDLSIKPGKIPSAIIYMDELAGTDWKEHDRQVRLTNRKTVDELKNLITKALETENRP
jgi:hypothetical protein